MNAKTCHENNGDTQGCHACMEQLTRKQQPLDVRRISLGLGFSLVSFIVFLFVFSKVLPRMYSVAEQGVLALLSLGAT